MQKFVTLRSPAIPLMRPNIDTDTIIPSREMTGVEGTGYGEKAFAGWRYDESRRERPDFILNKEPYRTARILLSGPNFGCGSSREQAVWALVQFGIRCVIAPSFGAIFANSSYRNGLLPVMLPEQTIESLCSQMEQSNGSATVEVDLESCTVTEPSGVVHGFVVPGNEREMLLKGLDIIDLTLERSEDILRFQAADREKRPWIYFESAENLSMPKQIQATGSE